MKLGRLHVQFTAGRRWHTQNKWPDSSWRTCYFENDHDWGDTPPEPNEVTEWDRILDSGVVVLFRVVSCYQIKFTISYRSFWLEVSNVTKWKHRSSHEQSKQRSTQLIASW